MAVVSEKGAIGKSSLGFELAAALDPVLVDFDWLGGGVTSRSGYDYHERRRQPLPDSLASGRTPHYLKRSYRPDLVPSHPDLTHFERGAGLADALLSRRLKSWAEEWQRTVIVDTHPGFNGLARAAVLAADLLVVPVLLRERDLNAPDRMLEEGLRENPVLLVPNMVPLITPRAQLQRLLRLLAPFAGMPVGPPLSFHPWWPRRRLRSALVLAPNPECRSRARRAFKSGGRGGEADCLAVRTSSRGAAVGAARMPRVRATGRRRTEGRRGGNRVGRR